MAAPRQMAASRAAAAVALLLLLAASQSASGEDALDISVTVKPEHASAVNQFVWSITAPPPTPSGLQIPITGSGSGTVNYSVTFTKDLLSTTITVSQHTCKPLCCRPFAASHLLPPLCCLHHHTCIFMYRYAIAPGQKSCCYGGKVNR